MSSNGSTDPRRPRFKSIDDASSSIVATGAMADRVRAYDWASTPLGPIENWSPTLTAMVNLTLSSPTPARMLWGPDLVLIYNEAYSYIPGKRHPEALGKAAREVYKNSWHVVGPILENALATGVSFSHEKLLVPIDTGDGLREFYLDYSYSPVIEEGRVTGLFGLLHDVTREVAALRTLKENEARAQRVLHSIGDAVIVTDADAQVVQMNHAAEALTGWLIADAQGKPLEQVFHIVD